MFNFIKKTFSSLNKTRKNIVNTFSKFHGKKYLSESELDELESVLFQADLNYDIIDQVLLEFKNKTLSSDESWESSFISFLKNKIKISDSDNEIKERVLLIIGVNGTGKTTTSAKLSNYYKNNGDKVILIGADTYRAAAVDQLKIWSEKLGVKFLSNPSTKDPASIVYDGINSGLKDDANRIIIDTAGRLHNSVNLMQELQKIHKISKKFNENIRVLLTIDSNVGQNGINQALEFNKFIPIDSLILTKMDGTAKGGIALSLIDQLNIPINFIGVGEGIDDLVPFNLDTYLNGLISKESNDE